MNRKATIYDYARFCEYKNRNCYDCILLNNDGQCDVRYNTDEANEIILKWIDEHPIKTRQSEFLKIFPNVTMLNDFDCIDILPCWVDKTLNIGSPCKHINCDDCKKEYWLEEI